MPAFGGPSASDSFGLANEVKVALAVAEAWGWIEDPAEARAILDRLLALLWRLTHPRG